eukprot:399664-Pyramimonas_sp.AAC.2
MRCIGGAYVPFGVVTEKRRAFDVHPPSGRWGRGYYRRRPTPESVDKSDRKWFQTGRRTGAKRLASPTPCNRK